MNFRTLETFVDRAGLLMPDRAREWKLNHFADAPLFVSNLSGEAHGKELLQDLDDTGEDMKLPFDRVRAIGAPQPHEDYEDGYLFAARKGRYMALQISRNKGSSNIGTSGAFTEGTLQELRQEIQRLEDKTIPDRTICFMLDKHPRIVQYVSKTEEEHEKYDADQKAIFDNYTLGKKENQTPEKWWNGLSLIEMKDRLDTIANARLAHTFSRMVALNLHIALVNFISLVNHPANHIVVVEPKNPEKRSVQWVMSKSHYLVLHAADAKQAENRQGFTDSTQVLTRSAHNRRAHFRTLNSDRYVHMKGQKIWIRSAWVGPKEWIGSDKKVYRVVGQTAELPTAESIR